MNTFKALILTLFMGTTAIAQDIEVNWGMEYPYDPKASTSVLGVRGDHLLAAKGKRKGALSFTKFDLKTLTPSGDYSLIGPASESGVLNAKEYTAGQYFLMKNKTYVIVNKKYDRKAVSFSVYAQELSNEGKKQGKMKKIITESADKRKNLSSYQMQMSEDSTKIFMVRNPPFKKYAGEKFDFRVLDDNLDELHHLEVELPYMDKNFSVYNYKLADDGLIYMMARIWEEKEVAKKNKKVGESISHYQIISVDPKSGDVAEYDLNLPKKMIMDISFTVDEEHLICSGFYGDIEVKGRKRSEINGIFFFRVNAKTKALENVGTKDLDKEFIEELIGERKANKGRGLSNTFELKEFVKKSDGSGMLIAEQYYMYVTQHCSTDPKTGARSCTYTYHYVRNNILVVNVNPDGSIKWYANIPKRQHTTNDAGLYSSYALMVKEDKLFFVYNDDYRNMDAEKNKGKGEYHYTMASPWRSTAVVVSLSEAGEFDKAVLFNSKESESLIRPESSIRLTQSDRVFMGSTKGSYFCGIPLKKALGRMARITIK